MYLKKLRETVDLYKKLINYINSNISTKSTPVFGRVLFIQIYVYLTSCACTSKDNFGYNEQQKKKCVQTCCNLLVVCQGF